MEMGGGMFMCALECEARVQPCVAPQALWCLKQSLTGTSVSLTRLGGLTSEPRDLPASASPVSAPTPTPAGLQAHHHTQLFFMGLED